jgi:hypothetical protein
VLNYLMRFQATAIDDAKRQALAEFPTDTTIVWFATKDTCAQMEVKSPSLGKALSDPTIGDAQGLKT